MTERETNRREEECKLSLSKPFCSLLSRPAGKQLSMSKSKDWRWQQYRKRLNKGQTQRKKRKREKVATSCPREYAGGRVGTEVGG